MTSPDTPGQDDAFVEWLMARHEAIVHGDLSSTGRPGAGLGGESLSSSETLIRQRSEQAERSLLALEALRRQRNESGHGANAGPAGFSQHSGKSRTSQPRLGRYVIEQEIGSGGLGLVFKAWDTSLERHVALKVPRPEALASSGLRRRLIAEAKVAARLRHPHLCTVYESAQAGYVTFLIMEYCNGPNLDQWLREHDGPVPLRFAASMFVQLAEGLQHAHDHGVLHRDLKPSNVLLDRGANDARTVEVGNDGNRPCSATEDLPAFTPKIADFGLAKLIEELGHATRTGTVLGTPGYMSPEQAGGQIRDIGVATDLFALGVMLYEVLTGRRPFDGQTTSDTIRKVLLADPLPPRRIRPDTPRDLEAICLKCLEKNPRQRYRSALLLAEDLSHWLDHEPIVARPIGPLQRLAKWTWRRPATTALIAVSLLSLAVILIGGRWQLGRLRQELATNRHLRSQAEARQQVEYRRRYLSDVQLAGKLWSQLKLAEMRRVLARQIPRHEELDHRDFVWHYLWRRCHDELTIYQGHTGTIAAVAYAPDGNRLATAAHDGTVRLFDTEKGEQLLLLAGHGGEVNCIAFSPDGKNLFSGDDDGMLRVWELDSGRQVLGRKAHGDDLLCMAISPDGKTLATGGSDNVIRLWQTDRLKPLGELNGHTDWVRALAFAPDGSLLASASDDATACLWEWREERAQRTLHGHQGWVGSVVFSPSGQQLATGSKDGTVRLWETLTGKEYWSSQTAPERIRAVAFSPDGRWLAAVGNSDSALLWSFSEGLGDGEQPKVPVQLRQIMAHTEDAWDVAFAPDSRTLVTVGADHMAKRWLADGNPHCDERWDVPGHVLRLAILGKGTVLVLARNGSIQGFGRWQRTEQTRYAWPQAFVDMGHSSAGSTLAVRGENGPVQLLEMDAQQPMLPLREDVHGVCDVACGSDGNTVFMAQGNGQVVAFDIATQTRRTIELAPADDCQFNNLVCSPDGRWLAARDGLSRKTLVVYDLVAQRIHARFEKCDSGMVFSPDGGLLATDMVDRTIVLWDVERACRVATLAGHEGEVVSLAFSPDGRVLASAVARCRNCLLRFWAVDQGEELLSIPLKLSLCRGLAFSPNGEELVLAGLGEMPGSSQVLFLSTSGPQAGDPRRPGGQFRYRFIPHLPSQDR
jgi:eukaryotic-like serine/threonine-protein kinase